MPGLLRSIPNAWGPKWGAETSAATCTRTGPNEIALTASANLALVMLSPQPDRMIALGGSRRSVGLAPVGALELVPAGADLFARWKTAKENLLFAIDQDHLARLAGAECQKEDFELHPPKIGVVDRKALSLAQLAREEFRRADAASELCFESLITLFAAHVLRSYSSLRDGREARPGGGLAPRTLSRVREHIEDNLSDRLSIAQLAEVARLSPGHFLRAFSKTVGQAPHQYVIDRRLALAERLIATSDRPLDEIAVVAGFSGNSHLTATMKRVRGRRPKDLRRSLGTSARAGG